MDLNEDIGRVLSGIDSGRRAGWKKFYVAKNVLETYDCTMRDVLTRLLAELQALIDNATAEGRSDFNDEEAEQAERLEFNINHIQNTIDYGRSEISCDWH